MLSLKQKKLKGAKKKVQEITQKKVAKVWRSNKIFAKA